MTRIMTGINSRPFPHADSGCNVLGIGRRRNAWKSSASSLCQRPWWRTSPDLEFAGRSYNRNIARPIVAQRAAPKNKRPRWLGNLNADPE